MYTSDDSSNEGVLKARWCIRGYLDPDVLDVQTASPTLSNEAFSVVLQILASFRWQLTIADIEGTFLQGDQIDRQKGKILVKIPKDGIPGHGQDNLCELIKPVYGLVDAPRLWWNSLTKALMEIGMMQSQLDSCLLFSREANGRLDGVIAFHVDDLVIGGSREP